MNGRELCRPSTRFAPGANNFRVHYTNGELDLLWWFPSWQKVEPIEIQTDIPATDACKSSIQVSANMCHEKKFLLLAGQDFSSSPLFGPVICDDGDGDTHSERFPSDRSTGGGGKEEVGGKREKQIVVAGSERNVVAVACWLDFAELLLLLLSRGASDYTRSFLPVAPERKSPPLQRKKNKVFFWLVAQTPSPRPEGEKRGGNFLSGRCVFS